MAPASELNPPAPSNASPGGASAAAARLDGIVEGRHDTQRSCRRFATGAGTIEVTSPPKRAISRMYFEAMNELADVGRQEDGGNACHLLVGLGHLQLTLEVGHRAQALHDEVGVLAGAPR